MSNNKATKELQQKAKAALEAIRKESVKSGASEMTLDEINEEIRQVREAKRKRKDSSWLSVDDYFEDLILEDIKKWIFRLKKATLSVKIGQSDGEIRP